MEKLSLTNCQINHTYKVIEIKLKNEQVLNQLKNCGIEIGSNLKVLLYNYKRMTALIESCGVNYMIGKNICDEIEVNEI